MIKISLCKVLVTIKNTSPSPTPLVEFHFYPGKVLNSIHKILISRFLLKKCSFWKCLVTVKIFLKSTDKSTGNVNKKDIYFENFYHIYEELTTYCVKYFEKLTVKLSFMVLVGANIGGTLAEILRSIFFF